MPLSEHEQRILEEIERRLVADDPKFAREVAAGGGQTAVLRRVKRAIIAFVIGFGLLITGLIVSKIVIFGVAAFIVMVPSVVVVVSSIKHVGRQRPETDGEEEKPKGWFSRIEERWRKRYEGGDET